MKRRIFVGLFIGLVLLVLVGCASSAPSRGVVGVVAEPPTSDSAMELMPTPAPTAYAPTENVQPPQQPDIRKVIYGATLDLVVNDTEASAQQATDLAQSLGGYVANMSAYRDGSQLYYDMTLRVPAQQFETARETLRKMAIRVESDNISTDDITDRYIDQQARLKTLQATETELQALLTETRERGGKVEEIMQVYRELVNIRTEIESVQGQLNAYDQLVALSTIQLMLRADELSEPIADDTWRPAQTLRDSFRSLINVLQLLFDLFARIIIVLVPVLAILAIPVIVVLLIIRWLRRRRQQHSDPTAG